MIIDKKKLCKKESERNETESRIQVIMTRKREWKKQDRIKNTSYYDQQKKEKRGDCQDKLSIYLDCAMIIYLDYAT